MEPCDELIVRQVMTSRVVTVDPQDSVAVAIRLMRQGQLHRLPVVKDNVLLGIITSSDLRRVTGLASILHDPSQDNFLWRYIPVSNAMSRNLITLTPDQPIAEAAQLMIERHIGGLPVVEQGQLVGILTTSDLLKAMMAVAQAAPV